MSYVDHAHRHLPGGSDPIPGAAAVEWFWCNRTTNLNINSSSTTDVAPWDTSDSAGSAFDMSDVAVGGYVYLLKTGIYAFSAQFEWTSTSVAPSFLSLEILLLSSGVVYPNVLAGGSRFEQFGPTGMLAYPPQDMSASGMVIVTALDSTMINNLVRLRAGQQSGTTKTLDVMSMAGVRLGDV